MAGLDALEDRSERNEARPSASSTERMGTRLQMARNIAVSDVLFVPYIAPDFRVRAQPPVDSCATSM